MRADIVLCEKADNELKNYSNVFDEIIYDEHNRLSFTAVCKLKFDDHTDNKMTLHFFLVTEDETSIKGKYLTEGTYVKDNKDIDEDSFKVEFKDIPLNGKGIYYFRIVRNDEMEDADSREAAKVYNTGTVIGETEFIVK